MIIIDFMKQKELKRIAIIGLPGSGKSTFSNKLGKALNIPVYHLDVHRFEKGGKKKDEQEFKAIQKALLDKQSWIIEGCSTSTFEMRFAKADTFMYFRLPRFLVFWRLVKRMFWKNNELTKTGCINAINWRLLKYTWNFDRENHEEISRLKNKYPDVSFYLFKRSKEVNEFLRKLSKIAV